MREGDSRCWKEGESRKHEVHKAKILLRHWSHTWHEKQQRRSKTPTPQISSPQKPSPCHITLRNQEGSHGTRCWLAPNVPERCRPIGEQISGTGYPQSHPWDKASISPWRVWPPPWETNEQRNKNWIINKEMKRTYSKERGHTEYTREEGRGSPPGEL
jgi:hypothetical protein